MNETGEVHTWVTVGAPPVGTVDDFGEYVLPEGAEAAESDGET